MQQSQHPALILGSLGVASGTLGTFFLGLGYGEAPLPGLYMVLTGLWFGLVIAYGLWRWGNNSPVALITAVAVTWLGWELAVNLALQMEESWLKATSLPEPMRAYVSGFAAGAVGAFLTWAGAAAFTRTLRQSFVLIGLITTGALFGLLLPWTSHYDHPAILLVPWQSAIAAMLGCGVVLESRQCRIAGMKLPVTR